ncbi:MAG: DNA polymerase III subunit delta' C-terminal domain-containing protein [Chlorobiota bacterium]
MAWSSIIGQHALKGFLQRAILQGRVAPAYCFWGPEGVGKDALALEFAKLLNCQSPHRSAEGIEACDVCQDCRQAARLEHPAIRLIFALPPPKTRTDGSPLLGLNDDQIALLREELRRKAEDPYHDITLPNALQIHIAAIRDLQRTLSMTPSRRGQRRVVIISEADRMTAEAANACLKTLEEPHDNTVFILTTSRRNSLPMTILSRCQQLFCPPLSDEELTTALQQRHDLSAAEARLAAAFAQGSYTKARLFAEHDIQTLRHHAIGLLRIALKPNRFRRELLHHIEQLFSSADRMRAELILGLLLVWLRDALVLSQSGNPSLLVNADQHETLSAFLRRFPEANLPAMVSTVDEAIRLLYRHVNVPLLVLTTLLRCRALTDPSLSQGVTDVVPAAA